MTSPTSSTSTASPQPPRFSLERDPWGHLVLTLEDGSRYSGVAAIRMFPVSSPEGPIALCDPRGREITWLPSLATVAADVRQMLEEDLAQRDFIPVITRVHRVSSLSEPCEWDVDTDRGRTTFVLRAEEDFHRLSPHRAIIVDSRGLRFLLADVRQLDAASRRFAEWYL